MTQLFDPKRIKRYLAFLGTLPESLFDDVVRASGQTLTERVSAVNTLRSSLLKGVLPSAEAMPWPEEPLRSQVLDALRRLDLARFCTGQPELTQALVRQLLASASHYEAEIGPKLTEVFEALKRQEAARLQAEAEEKLRAQSREDKAPVRGSKAAGRGRSARRSKGGKREEASGQSNESQAEAIKLDDETLHRLREEARRILSKDAASAATQALVEEWKERAEAWVALEEVFGELGQLLGGGWDLSLGLLQQSGWQEVLRLRALVQHIPALKTLIQCLGRLQVRPDNPESETVSSVIFGPVRRESLVQVDRLSPHAVADTRGVTRTGSISRMLPSEAALLGHPTLSKLWHARRAERLLMSYRVEGMVKEWTTMEIEALEAGEQKDIRNRDRRGPIILCLDTSGSMAGLPEQVAKALVLEALRTALIEGRRCLVFSFSGPGQLAEMELELTPDGLAELLSFLIQSFHGGTDVDAPLRAAAARLRTERWEKADVLLLSDGEFGVASELVEMVSEVKEDSGARVHGVLIGGYHSAAMERLCDPLHRFTEWRGILA